MQACNAQTTTYHHDYHPAGFFPLFDKRASVNTNQPKGSVEGVPVFVSKINMHSPGSTSIITEQLKA